MKPAHHAAARRPVDAQPNDVAVAGIAQRASARARPCLFHGQSYAQTSHGRDGRIRSAEAEDSTGRLPGGKHPTNEDVKEEREEADRREHDREEVAKDQGGRERLAEQPHGEAGGGAEGRVELEPVDDAVGVRFNVPDDIRKEVEERQGQRNEGKATEVADQVSRAGSLPA